MNRTTRILLATVGLALVVALALFVKGRSARAQAKDQATGDRRQATGSNGEKAAPAASVSPGADRIVPVTTAIATRKDVPVVLEGLGTVTPIATVTVKSQVDGRLDRVLFVEGQSVKKGDVIALIDPRPFAIQLHTAQAAFARDDAQLRNGNLNLERYETLRKGNLIPQQQVDDQRALVAQLEGTTRGDQAQIDSARLMLDYARITSPIEGVTGVRQVDPGNLVHTTDTTGIVLLTQIDPITVVFTLPQDELPRVQRAMKEGKVAVSAFARDGIQQLGAGELMLVDNQVNAQTATIRLKARLPNPDHALWPNAFVKARMNLSTLKDVLVVPASVVQRGPNGTFAYVVGADSTVAPRTVEVGSVEGDVAVIAKGLNAGDVVVTDGQNQLRPGSKVSARSPASPAAPAKGKP